MRALWGPLLLVAAVFCAGWVVRGWYNNGLALAASESAETTRQIVTEVTRKSGQALEEKLAELKANEVHTERVIRTETIKPVFSNVCASDEYVRLFNESAERAERVLSGKPVNPLSDQPATTGR
ncbi:hypothetical protein [Cedecea davisae]|uniref:hypothetical protein n=1 Tax=Cedecea davisae TaxID=158484 RepID=UPI002430E58F|nr:hypothetical protein [Cedecea davisae]